MAFSFVYNGNKIHSENLIGKTIGDKTVYALDALTITEENRILSENGIYTLLWFENSSDKDSGTLSDICDIDAAIPFKKVCSFSMPGMDGAFVDTTKIVVSEGCNGVVNEFVPKEVNLRDFGNEYECMGGRSSQGVLPYFEAKAGEEGILLGIGWSGQWFCRFLKESDTFLRIQAGIPKLSFYLRPKEKIRTASILTLRYEKDSQKTHNEFRKIMRDNFSLLQKPGREGAAPLSLLTWGGARSSYLKKQIKKSVDLKLGFEYYWMDAGWYGDYTEECPDSFVGKRGDYTGDWTVNRLVHPDGIAEVFSCARDAGMQGILWLEPERVRKSTKFYQSHPDMFIDIGKIDTMLDLSKKSNQDYVIDTVSHYIQECGLKCYRQDCNFDLLPYWEKADEPGRTGLKQIYYIMGLYRVWDELLQRFPNLLIDNCSSGGKRLDFEAGMRSITLWRSDMNCTFDFNPDLAQNQNMGLMQWVPYHGCGMGIYPDDAYRFRSCHGAALSTDFLGYERFENVPHDFALLRQLIEEYKSVRAFYDKDYYPIFGFPEGDAVWAGWQLHDPDKNEGIICAFRRKNCLSNDVTVLPRGLDENTDYLFEDIDSGASLVYSSADPSGLTIRAEKRPFSKLLRYRALR